MEPVETFRFKDGSVLKIYYDPDPLNPRHEWDQPDKIVCFHRRYDLGDEHDFPMSLVEQGGWEALEEAIQKKYRVLAILPIYMMDHSGLDISHSPARYRACDPHGWDWGQVGFIFTTRKIMQQRGFKLGARTQEKALEILKISLEEYNDYLGGRMYGYVHEDPDGEELGSCWGFVGWDHWKSGLFGNLPVAYYSQLPPGKEAAA